MDTSLTKNALRLEWFTLSWNVLEAVVAIVAGLVAGSIALIGFGLDSVVESASAVILLWRLRQTGEAAERAERRAVRLVGVSFFVLAAYVTWEAVSALIQREAPQTSLPGIVLATLSLIVMPLLARAKARLAREMGSRALAADSKETLACAFLSATLLAGLVANAWLGWWWADPVAALGIVIFLVREGWEAFEQD
jgi:divalent metal cation (Fe/Co/Zn/Cd) transporter